MNNTFFASFTLLSISSCLVSYSMELPTNITVFPFYKDVKTLCVRAAAPANVTIIENEVYGLNYSYTSQDDPEMEFRNDKSAWVKIKSDATFLIPAEHPINLDIETKRGDVSLTVNTKRRRKWDVFVKQWTCMNNKTRIDLKWSYTWFWLAHYINELPIIDENAPIVKIWAQDGNVLLHNTKEGK